MKLTWDEAKRQKILQERQLDFKDASEILTQCHLQIPDDRMDYGEPRFIVVGFLQQRMMVLVYTPRNEVKHIISMRKANEREIKKYTQFFLD
jgi:uncharacterized DUF497 family protein